MCEEWPSRRSTAVYILTGDCDRLLGVPLSLEVGQLAVEVTAVAKRHVGKAQLRRAGVDDDHVGRRTVAFIVVTKADGRTVVVARVRLQDATDEHQHAAHLHHRVVRQQVYTSQCRARSLAIINHLHCLQTTLRFHFSDPPYFLFQVYPKKVHFVWHFIVKILRYYNTQQQRRRHL